MQRLALTENPKKTLSQAGQPQGDCPYLNNSCFVGAVDGACQPETE